MKGYDFLCSIEDSVWVTRYQQRLYYRTGTSTVPRAMQSKTPSATPEGHNQSILDSLGMKANASDLCKEYAGVSDTLKFSRFGGRKDAMDE